MSNETTNLDFTFLNKWQKAAFENIKKFRYSVLIIHRRAGKSVLSIAYLIYKALKVPNKDLGYLGPYLNQTKSIAWSYLKKFKFHRYNNGENIWVIEIVDTIEDQEKCIKLPAPIVV